MTPELAPAVAEMIEDIKVRLNHLEVVVDGWADGETVFKGLWDRMIHLEGFRDIWKPVIRDNEDGVSATRVRVIDAEDDIQSLRIELEVSKEYLGVDRVQFLETWRQRHAA